MSNNENNTKTPGFLSRFYHNHMIISTLLIMAVIVVFLGYFSMFFIDVWTNHGNTTIVPEVRKKSFAEAVEILQKNNVVVEIADSIYDSNMSPGQVKEVWPRPGTKVKPGRTVYLTINSFQPQKVTINMPLTGVSSRQAITYLESLNIKNARIVYVKSNFPDLVEGAKYKGKNIVPGMQIPVTANIVLEVGKLEDGARSKATVKSDGTSSKSKKEDYDDGSDEVTQPEPIPSAEMPEEPAPKSAPADTPEE